MTDAERVEVERMQRLVDDGIFTSAVADVIHPDEDEYLASEPTDWPLRDGSI